MKQLQILGLVLIAMLFANTVFSQDTTQYEVYDVIYLTDGRVLKGQILSYDSQLGGISFRDIHGRVYNFSREEYKYFLEKQAFPIKKEKSKKPLRERKTEGIRFNLGINTSLFYVREYQSDDDFSRNYRISGSTISLSGTVGKYLSNEHFVGLSADLGIISSDPKFYNFGIRYNYIYDNKQRNMALYIPIEMKYQHMILAPTVLDFTEQTPNSSISGQYRVRSVFSTVFLSIGHGIGFIMKNGGAFNIELAYQYHFVASQRFVEEFKPNDVGYTAKHDIHGFRLGLSLSF